MEKNKRKVIFFINFNLLILIITLIGLSIFSLANNYIDDNNQNYEKSFKINYDNFDYEIDQETIELKIKSDNNINESKYYYSIIENFINEELTDVKNNLENEYYISKFIVLEFYFAKHNLFTKTFFFNNIFDAIFSIISNLNNIIYGYDIIWITPNEFVLNKTTYLISLSFEFNGNGYDWYITFIEINSRMKYVTINSWNDFYIFDENYEYFHEINLFIYNNLVEIKFNTKKELWNKTSIIVGNIPTVTNLQNFLISVYVFESLLNANKNYYINKIKYNKIIISNKIKITVIIWSLANKLQYFLIDNINGEIYISFYFEFEDNNWIYSFEYNNKITYEIGNIQLENNRDESTTIKKMYHDNIRIIIFLITIMLLLIITIVIIVFMYIKKQRNIKKNYYI